MVKNLSFDNHVLYKKLIEYIKDMNLTLITTQSLIITTKNNLFYEFSMFDKDIPSILESNECDINSKIKSKIVDEMCNKKIIDLCYGYDHYIAVTDDKKIYCWGENYYELMYNGKKDNDPKHVNKHELNQFLSDLKIQDIKCGPNHSLALTHYGDVYAWGSNSHGQCGNHCEITPISSEDVSPEDENISLIFKGSNQSIALTENSHFFKLGEVNAWNESTYRIEDDTSSDNFQLTPFKINSFGDEKFKMISCGGYHSMALTKSGRVSVWGSNQCGQLGKDDIEYSYKPLAIELANVSFKKISCGAYHNLLLSDEGDIYAFGSNICGQIGNGKKETDKQTKLIKLYHQKKFVDISSHWSKNISMTQSFDNIFYIWGGFDEEILTPIETKFKSFNEAFSHYFEQNLEASTQLIKFGDLVFRNGNYDKSYFQIVRVGKGSYGKVYKVRPKGCLNKFYAIKKIKINIENMKMKISIFKEAIRYALVKRTKDQFVVKHFDTWLEMTGEIIIFHIKMDLCDQTLREKIKEIHEDLNMIVTETEKRTLTPIGYFLASQLFIEIIECVQHLHKRNPPLIHRDLNLSNIMLKRDKNSNRFIKIVDFGLATIHEFAEKSHSQDKGNIHYIAPEVREGRKYDTKADIYSLGIILKRLFDIDMNRLVIQPFLNYLFNHYLP
jgi:alpha-tubulin suppressor-like RCC1 family protein